MALAPEGRPFFLYKAGHQRRGMTPSLGGRESTTVPPRARALLDVLKGLILKALEIGSHMVHGPAVRWDLMDAWTLPRGECLDAFCRRRAETRAKAARGERLVRPKTQRKSDGLRGSMARTGPPSSVLYTSGRSSAIEPLNVKQLFLEVPMSEVLDSCPRT